jgi:hypothetical protein
VGTALNKLIDAILTTYEPKGLSFGRREEIGGLSRLAGDVVGRIVSLKIPVSPDRRLEDRETKIRAERT